MAHASAGATSVSFWPGVSVAAWLWLAMLTVGGPGSSLDEAALRFAYAGAGSSLARVAALLTTLGGWVFPTVLTVAGAIYLVVAKRHASLLVTIVLGGRVAVALMKVIVGRDRPDIEAPLVATHSMSFPSGHAANAMITALALALLVPVRRQTRVVAATVGVTVALAVGWTRVVLGVHWPSDVIGGWAFGVLWTLVCLRLASGASRSRTPSSNGGPATWPDSQGHS